MDTYIVNAVELQTYNKEHRLYVDLTGKGERPKDKRMLFRQQNIGELLRLEPANRPDWRTRAEDKWLNIINGWYSGEFPERFVFVKVITEEFKNQDTI